MPVDFDKLAAAFAAKGLTLEAAGVRMGFGRATARQNFSRLLKGRRADPSIRTVEKLCDVLGVAVVDILTDDSPARGPRPNRR